MPKAPPYITLKRRLTASPYPSINSPDTPPEENGSRPRCNLIQDWFSRCDTDQESIKSNSMSEIMSIEPASEVQSALAFQTRAEYPSTAGYRVLVLGRNKIQMIQMDDRSTYIPTWIREFVKRIAVTQTDEHNQTTKEIKQLYIAIIRQLNADDEDTMGSIYDHILAGLLLQKSTPWENTFLCSDLQFGLKSLVDDMPGPLMMAIPKPAMTVGYNYHQLKNIPSYDTTHKSWTVDNKNTMWLPYLVVEINEDMNECATVNRLLGTASACLNVNRRVITQNNIVFSLLLQRSQAILYVTWYDSGHYRTRIVKSFTLIEQTHFLILRRYIYNIIKWGSTRRLQHIHQVIFSGNVPEPAESSPPTPPAPAMPRTMPPAGA
ncbi:uncharacterized protein GGS22DRAFT_174061 [Annulohypoxylon maeteangense]|uniref:uncharacterized protein n=1 Tax=Annulohypoxylon maeteangense TaxID=1927788 RepID=UPI002008EB77|nr:uncharacterized protein GGS22DRAFT_174061 [Annulohypoxylon maeteangense]KAI0880726.1 hypothetical protein GGS22DRAFT_174061 [Annulohypoxylon maeteangense]